ncbi:MAG: FKBP-type peptidyl-prolyl cis-trans isomerase [Planctomycetota bacterium]
MRHCLFSLLLVSLFTAPLFAQTDPSSDTPKPPQTTKERASYSIGRNVGNSLTSQGLDGEIVNPAMLSRGILDVLTGADSPLSEAEQQEAMQAFAPTLQKAMQAKQQEMQAEQQELQAEQQKRGAEAKKEGEAFLAKNAEKQGVETLPSGLQYKVIKEGTGDSPEKTDTVRVHYDGTFIDGTKFDSSIDRGEPAEFPVDGVIPGWTEALQEMKVGGKWKLVVPAKLAYGEQGNRAVPPNSVLVFEVELLEIK